MKACLTLAIVCSILAAPVIAADKISTKKATAKGPDKEAAAPATQTDIIGSEDAPMVFNVVPWKDRETLLPKNPLEASVLEETIDPVDRDVVRREVDFSRALQTMPAMAATPTP